MPVSDQTIVPLTYSKANCLIWKTGIQVSGAFKEPKWKYQRHLGPTSASMERNQSPQSLLIRMPCNLWITGIKSNFLLKLFHAVSFVEKDRKEDGKPGLVPGPRGLDSTDSMMKASSCPMASDFPVLFKCGEMTCEWQSGVATT